MEIKEAERIYPGLEGFIEFCEYTKADNGLRKGIEKCQSVEQLKDVMYDHYCFSLNETVGHLLNEAMRRAGK